MLWRREIGKGSPMESKSHRVCGRTWEKCTIVSVYGNAQRADLDWYHTMLTEAADLKAETTICLGEYNWKKEEESTTWMRKDSFGTRYPTRSWKRME